MLNVTIRAAELDDCVGLTDLYSRPKVLEGTLRTPYAIEGTLRKYAFRAGRYSDAYTMARIV